MKRWENDGSTAAADYFLGDALNNDLWFMVKDTFWQQLYINIWGKSLEKIIGRGIHK